LPFLEAIDLGRADAKVAPKRLCFIYGGTSRGHDGGGNTSVPDAPGPDYELKRGLEPLGAGMLSNPGLGNDGFDVQKHVSVVSGLKIPWATGGSVPLGGKSKEFHGNTIGPQISGMRGNSTRTSKPKGPSFDQIVAAQIADADQRAYLSLRVQAASYVGSNNTGGDSSRISWASDGNGGVDGIDSNASPELAYSTLFGQPLPTGDPAAEAAAELRSRRRVSAVDIARQRAESLIPKLGTEDRIRMEKHLDELRDLETRVNKTVPIGGGCQQPTDPGPDPSVAGAAKEYKGQGGNGSGYSDEETRATSMFDIINMAFACDLTRVASVRMTFSQSFMQMKDLLGYNNDLHELGHSSGGDNAVADIIGWHVKHFARFISLLRDTQDVDGATLLDNTAVIMLFEGGHGYDPEGDKNTSPHSTENMIALVGGHAGGLNPSGGKHIETNKKHPAKVAISVMNAVGVAQQSETLGEVTGRIDELFT